jgi:hypothetical protein
VKPIKTDNIMKFAVRQEVRICVTEYVEAKDELDAHRLARNLLNDVDDSIEFQYYDIMQKKDYDCRVEKWQMDV